MRRQAREMDEIDETEIDDIPVPPTFKVLRRSGYGSVPGLDDEELADPEELEDQVYKGQFEAILRLPVEPWNGGIRPNIDESGKGDFGAFATVDFDRICPEFDKAKYKAQKLREQLKDLMIMAEIVSNRIFGKAKYRVLKYVLTGYLDLDCIANEDLLALAKMYLMARTLRQEITRLQEVSSNRRKTKAAEMFGDD